MKKQLDKCSSLNNTGAYLNPMKPKHLAELEKSHRFCIKLMQSLPRSTSTGVANLPIGLNSIEVEIDYRKLIFLGNYAICLTTT